MKNYLDTVKFIIEKANRKQAWGEHLTDAGFERDQFDNKYGKRIIIWTKDGIDYTAKPSSDEAGNLILSLTEYK